MYTPIKWSIIAWNKVVGEWTCLTLTSTVAITWKGFLFVIFFLLSRFQAWWMNEVGSHLPDLSVAGISLSDLSRARDIVKDYKLLWWMRELLPLCFSTQRWLSVSALLSRNKAGGQERSAAWQHNKWLRRWAVKVERFVAGAVHQKALTVLCINPQCLICLSTSSKFDKVIYRKS